MPKVKTRTAAKKRFRITKTGKIMRGRQYGRHLKTKKSASRSRRHKEPAKVTGKSARTIRRMLPYS
ncbi:50S ribosomal protein L35 [Candidatus Microgenomates bacterium]|nr:50S ribosomal protein L35 [Candidatus Microgenomates bacterium]